MGALAYVNAEKGKIQEVAKRPNGRQATRGSSIAFGEYGLQAAECGWITARQIEAARIAMTRYVKRGGKIWIRVFPHKSVTSKPAENPYG